MNRTLLQDYITEKMSIREIAKKENISYTTARYWIKKHGLITVPIFKMTSEKSREILKVRWKNVKTLDTVDWTEIQCEYNTGASWRKVIQKFNLSNQLIFRAVSSGLLVSRTKSQSKRISTKKHQHSMETKKELSRIRKNYLKFNPDKHPWKSNEKFKSVPCEHLKNILTINKIKFEEEYQPMIHLDKYYSIDIAFPEKKIGIEVNGNQHYNSDKTLKTYYQYRHDLIEKCGWMLIELHYLDVFNPIKVDELMTLVK